MELIFKVNIFWKRWLPLSFTVLHVLGEWLVLPPIIIGVPWMAHSDPSSLEPFLSVGFAASNQPSRLRKCLLLRQIAGWLIVCYKKKDSPSLGFLFWKPPAAGAVIHLGPSASPPPRGLGLGKLIWHVDISIIVFVIKSFKTDTEVMCLLWASTKLWQVSKLAWSLGKISHAS